MILPTVSSFIEGLDVSSIPGERIEPLHELIAYLREKRIKEERVNLNFICTHNSRRSQLCQVWAQTFGYYFGIDRLQAFSGGTEATAFHPNAVRALKDSGFQISKEKKEKNPVYRITFSEQAKPLICFSKLYHQALSEGEPFAAILTCSDAEANCPFIPEAETRFSIKYEDPKKADGTPQELEAYANRNRQIATEMYYVFTRIKN